VGIELRADVCVSCVCFIFSSGCCMCFIWMLHMFQCLYTHVASVYSKYFGSFIWMLYVFICMLHMLQWLYAYVASLCSKCLTYFRCMLQVFYLYVAYVAVAIYICCRRMFQFVSPCFSMLQQVLLPTRSDSRARTRSPSQCYLSLSCGPAPIVGRARNGAVSA
jgi:hypothetical protein